MRKAIRVLVTLGALALVLAIMPQKAVTLRGGLNGDDWLQMDKRERLGYVGGYLDGLREGWARGCFNATNIVGEKEWTEFGRDPTSLCMDREPLYPKRPRVYSALLTQYYEMFEDDRRVPFRELIELMASPPERTLTEIHAVLHRD
jgi:hypothetical protein